jgi:hypothetical protein
VEAAAEAGPRLRLLALAIYDAVRADVRLRAVEVRVGHDRGCG